MKNNKLGRLEATTFPETFLKREKKECYELFGGNKNRMLT